MEGGSNICGDGNGLYKFTWVEEQALRSKSIVNSFITLALCSLLLFVSVWANTKAPIALEGSALPSSLVDKFCIRIWVFKAVFFGPRLYPRYPAYL